MSLLLSKRALKICSGNTFLIVESLPALQGSVFLILEEVGTLEFGLEMCFGGQNEAGIEPGARGQNPNPP